MGIFIFISQWLPLLPLLALAIPLLLLLLLKHSKTQRLNPPPGPPKLPIIDEHLERAESKGEHGREEDIIDVLVGIMRDQSSPIHITADHIKALLMNIFMAGMSTSAVAMVWTMTELARKPELMKKAQDEIRGKVGKKGKVEESDLEQLLYLKMVVQESLRLHPPGALLPPRECVNHCKVNGYDIKSDGECVGNRNKPRILGEPRRVLAGEIREQLD